MQKKHSQIFTENILSENVLKIWKFVSVFSRMKAIQKS